MLCTAKQVSRTELLRDLEYFLWEAAQRAQALIDLEADGDRYQDWEQTARIVLAARAAAKRELGEARRREQVALQADRLIGR